MLDFPLISLGFRPFFMPCNIKKSPKHPFRGNQSYLNDAILSNSILLKRSLSALRATWQLSGRLWKWRVSTIVIPSAKPPLISTSTLVKITFLSTSGLIRYAMHKASCMGQSQAHEEAEVCYMPLYVSL